MSDDEKPQTPKRKRPTRRKRVVTPDVTAAPDVYIPVGDAGIALDGIALEEPALYEPPRALIPPRRAHRPMWVRAVGATLGITLLVLVGLPLALVHIALEQVVRGIQAVGGGLCTLIEKLDPGLMA